MNGDPMDKDDIMLQSKTDQLWEVMKQYQLNGDLNRLFFISERPLTDREWGIVRQMCVLINAECVLKKHSVGT